MLSDLCVPLCSAQGEAPQNSLSRFAFASQAGPHQAQSVRGGCDHELHRLPHIPHAPGPLPHVLQRHAGLQRQPGGPRQPGRAAPPGPVTHRGGRQRPGQILQLSAGVLWCPVLQQLHDNLQACSVMGSQTDAEKGAIRMFAVIWIQQKCCCRDTWGMAISHGLAC